MEARRLPTAHRAPGRGLQPTKAPPTAAGTADDPGKTDDDDTEDENSDDGESHFS